MSGADRAGINGIQGGSNAMIRQDLKAEGIEILRFERRVVPYMIERLGYFDQGVVFRDIGATSKQPGAKILWEGWRAWADWEPGATLYTDLIAMREKAGWACVGKFNSKTGKLEAVTKPAASAEAESPERVG